MLFACSNPQESPDNKLDSKYEPFMFMHSQRSYPDPHLDFDEFDRVMKKAAFHAQNTSATAKSTNTPWTQQGPTNIGGRLNCVAVHPDDEAIQFVGCAAGGIFKTVDSGDNWYPVGDDFTFLAISSIVFDPINPEVIYAGSGDHNISGLPHIGNGVYKSTDGGETWEHKGLTEQRIISRIVVDTENSDIIFAATMGLPFEPNEDRGLYKSSDGGDNWEQVLFVDETAGIIDLVMNPEDPSVLFASSWNRIRNNSESLVAGTDAHIYRSTNGGADWDILTDGLPADTMSRIGLAMSGQNPDHLFALYIGQNYQIHGLYRTVDGGDSWGEVNISPDMGNAMGGFGWYFGQVRINPQDEGEISILGVDLWTTNDGGANWYMSTPPWWQYSVHADKHDMIYLESGDILLATDGGLYRADSDLSNWEDVESLPNTQFYRVAINPHNPGYYTGGAQDNGTTTGNLDEINDWVRDYGGDGFQAIYDPYNNLRVYAETQNGNIVVNDGVEWSNFTGGINEEDRVNWDAPLIMSHTEQNVMYTGTYRVYKNSFAPFSDWEPISEDLTDGVIFGSNFHTISVVAESKLDPQVLYAGTTDANVWRSLDGGENWDQINEDLPERYVTSIETSEYNPAIVYVTHSGYKDNDNVSYIHKSEDYGSSWESISGDLPDLPVNHVEPFDDNQIFAATDAGVYFTLDGGEIWERVGNNMPMIPVFDIKIDTLMNVLVAGTFARSIQTIPLDSLVEEIIVTDIPELIEKNLAYPNPFSTGFNLDIQPDQTAFVFASNGKLMAKIQGSQYVPTNTWAAGMYFVITEENGVSRKTSLLKL